MTDANDILIVDDEIPNLQLLAGLLEKEGYQVRPAEKAQTALESALTKPPGLILLDVRMPDMDGFELCRRLKEDKRTQHVPILFVSALQDTEARVQGFEAGGVDFISKPFQESEILARVKTHLQMHRMQQHLEQLVDERTSELSKNRASLERKVGELQESEERLSLIYDSVADVLFYISVESDDCFRFLSINYAFLETTGLTSDQIVGKRIEQVIPEMSVRLVLDNYKKAIKENRIVRWEETSVYPSGEKIGDVSVAPVLNNKGICTHLVGSVHDVTNRKLTEIKVTELKNQLEAESVYLQEEIRIEHNFENIIGQSDALKYVLHRVEQVASTDSPVLILGETGTGKELIARALHKLSLRSRRPLVKVNCAALPGALIESELFGREKGAFTGAITTQLGRFELAKGSTLFLDEIGELPFELQAKLLRVLESGEFERLGNSHTLHSDARIIAATNRQLEEEVKKRRFREDLWYRLKVFPITVPPLRKRPEDIPMLVEWFVEKLAKKMGKRAAIITKRSMQRLQAYPWPGNVRELEHTVEAALISSRGKKLNFELPKLADHVNSDFKTFKRMERDYILRVLKAWNWKIGGKNSASSTLGMHVNTLRGRMEKLGIKKP
jgi:formate hydrogenlyase transcriptional activator